jgi:hypothetical protein
MTLDTVDPETGKVQAVEIEVGYPVCLQAMEGASALQVRIRQADSLVFVGELALSAGERVTLSFKSDPPGVDCGGRPVFHLNFAQLEDAPVLLPPDTGGADIVFLIDGTSLHPSSAETLGQPARFVGTPEWEQLSGSWVPALFELSRRFPDGIRTAVFAFGDFPMPAVAPAGYVLHPAESERKLRRLGPEGTLKELRRLPSCSGGDFVDALAEGLEACQHVGWRQNARKLVIIVGDSPGYSLIHAGKGVLDLADARCRTRDVTDEALHLHTAGIEIATVLLAEGLERLEQISEDAERLVAHTRRQYQELASVPAWALSSRHLELGSFFASWADWKEPLARGAAPGILVR